MANNFGVSITGVNDIRTRLAAIPDNLVKNVFRRAVRQGCNLIAERARENFVGAVEAYGGTRSGTESPHTVSGALKASIRVTPRRGTPTRVVFNVVAGGLTGAQKRKFGMDSAYYALWVERGHINRKMGDALKGGKRNKAIARAASASNTPAHPFMTPAVVSEADRAIQTIQDAIANGIQSL